MIENKLISDAKFSTEKKKEKDLLFEEFLYIMDASNTFPLNEKENIYFHHSSNNNK